MICSCKFSDVVCNLKVITTAYMSWFGHLERPVSSNVRVSASKRGFGSFQCCMIRSYRGQPTFSPHWQLFYRNSKRLRVHSGQVRSDQSARAAVVVHLCLVSKGPVPIGTSAKLTLCRICDTSDKHVWSNGWTRARSYLLS